MARSPQGRNRNLLPPHLQPGSQPRRASQQPREDQHARPPAPRHAAPDDRRCPLLSPLHPAPAQRDSELLPTRTRPLRRLTLCQTISAPRNKSERSRLEPSAPPLIAARHAPDEIAFLKPSLECRPAASVLVATSHRPGGTGVIEGAVIPGSGAGVVE